MINSLKETFFNKQAIKNIIFVEVVIAVTIILNLTVILNANVPSSSMENTIMKNDKIIGNRLAYTFSEPERGDIVIIRDNEKKNKLLVKRIIALPGEIVEVRDGLVYLNFSATPIDEPYAEALSFMEYGPYTVPNDSYFLLGDNRNNSNDSRFWADPFVYRKNIRAKVILKYWKGFEIY